MSEVVKRMEGARDIAKGTMPMHVIFKTEAEVKEALAWMKGKKNVKNLTPMTADDPRRKMTPMEMKNHK